MIFPESVSAGQADGIVDVFAVLLLVPAADNGTASNAAHAAVASIDNLVFIFDLPHLYWNRENKRSILSGLYARIPP